MSAMTRAIRLSMPKRDPLAEMIAFTAAMIAQLDDWSEDEWWVEERVA